MLKPITITAAELRNAPEPLPENNVKYVFKMMHGFYGTLFLSKYATGLVNNAGQDRGIISARAVWTHALRDYNETVLIEAMGRCETKHTEFPPSLPQFIALCVASLPPAVYVPAQPAIGMSQAARSSFARRSRELIASKAATALKNRTGYCPLPLGLEGLGLAIADAVASAGGDEVACLRDFNRNFSGVAA